MRCFFSRDARHPLGTQVLVTRALVLLLALDGWMANLCAGNSPHTNSGVPQGLTTSGHWSFQPMSSVTVPGPAAGNTIDAFLNKRFRESGVEPVQPASQPELLRRITYDLTGLPPTPTELREFLQDTSANAYGKVVDKLLASPAFGEHWAQHWLDLAHYADSNGFELDADRPDAWRYRDWVIKAFNEDLPYDHFVTLQVAGDEAEPGDHSALIAAGFARSGPREVVGGNIDPEVRRQDELTATTATVGSVFLGLTVGCARCHDHKFDPFPTVDYYRLQAFFAGAQLNEIPIYTEEEKKRFDEETARIDAQIKPLAEAQAKIEEPFKNRLAKTKETGLTAREREIRDTPKDKRTAEEARLFEGISVALRVTWEEIADAVRERPANHEIRESLKRQIHELQLQRPRPLAHAMTMTESATNMPDTRVLQRGSVKAKLGKVDPAPPALLLASMKTSPTVQAPTTPLDPTRSGRRLALARWLIAPNNPLTARVIVNRLWQHHFGRGLVATASDFGIRGERPSHPELLDWLAQELIQNGWRLKPLHRLMTTSQAYRRASQGARDSARDPGNLYLGRMNKRRMEAEGFRDSILAVSGLLNRKSGGPGVCIPLEPEVRALIFTEAEVVDLWPLDRDLSQHFRRSIYVHRKRNIHYPLFDAFDAPDALTPCPRRPVSTHAPQALVMLNSSFAQQSARAFASSLLEGSSSDSARIREAFLRCYARPPSAAELQDAQAFIGNDPFALPLERWTDFTLALVNSNEFIYVP
ncbi:MAG: DUF1553 domain-containing protein [Pedosphaera sp.]|nr:DUF1553 domain-containing protein [Pedosphaera sp.]